VPTLHTVSIPRVIMEPVKKEDSLVPIIKTASAASATPAFHPAIRHAPSRHRLSMSSYYQQNRALGFSHKSSF
jgi:hypothetical protein